MADLTPTPVCSVCGAAISPAGGPPDDRARCHHCLLRAGGLDGDGGQVEGSTQENVATTNGPSFAVPPLLFPGAPPRRFAHYELALDPSGGSIPVELGRGAMGVTYLARDTVLDCPVALKVIDPRFSAAHPEARTRFLREAKAAASLRHPNVASVFHYGEQGGHCFYAMELVEGETLQARVRREGPLRVDLALEVARQVTRALVAAETRGIVHRDLKPANLMISPGQGSGGDGGGGEGDAGDGDDGPVVKVIDFGLAKAVALRAGASGAGAADLTHGGFVGTPAYASPEQFAMGEGEAVDPRSDIYSLGVTLWFLLTGRVPFAGRSLSEINDRQLHHRLPLEQLAGSHVPAPVVTLLRAMLAADPADRPQNARELAGRLRHCRGEAGAAADVVTTVVPAPASRVGHRRHPVRRLLLVVGGVGALALAVAVAALSVGLRRSPRAFGPPPPPGPGAAEPAANPIPEKSVAVLPFENLSDDQANAFFADGMQEEILTNLAQVAELKVISRSSVMPYRDAAKRSNLPALARALGVTHIVEGSVQRTGNQIRVSAQLIDARNDAHRWAERYDRNLSDVFALQSEIAERIAEGLRAKLSPREKAAIDARPTADLAAYDLYLQARELVAGFQETADWRETLLRAVRLLDEATRRDGNFALAWCLAAKAHDQLYFTGLDASPRRLSMQESAVSAALRLQPELGEAHLARARLLYRGPRDYEGARRELALARAALPNSSEGFALASYIDRRLGRWPETLENQGRASSLDPGARKVFLEDQTLVYDMLRRYPEEIRAAEAAMKEFPGSEPYYRLIKAQALLAAGRSARAQTELDALPPGFDPNGSTTYSRVCAALFRGRVDLAADALAAFRGAEYTGFNGAIMPRAWLEALVARAAGRAAQSQNLLLSLRESAELAVRQRPDDPFALALRGQVDAGLGRKAEAMEAGRRAVGMRPVSADAMDGPGLLTSLALICAWSGEPEAAMRHLLTLARMPGGPDFGQLRNDPAWAPLRSRADYQAMVAQLDPHLPP